MKFLGQKIMRATTLFVVLVLGPVLALAQAGAKQAGFVESFSDEIVADFRFHYSQQPLTKMAIGFGVAGVLANTNADEDIQQLFRDHLTGDLGGDLASLFSGVGDVALPMYSFPIYLGAMWFGRDNGEFETSVARWGANSLRAAIVAMPQLIVLSHVAGGQIPEAGEPGWDPFVGDNGASGHSYFGAVPIITAARLADKRWVKYALYTTSILPGRARVYKDKHYFSQSFLGGRRTILTKKTIEKKKRE